MPLPAKPPASAVRLTCEYVEQIASQPTRAALKQQAVQVAHARDAVQTQHRSHDQVQGDHRGEARQGVKKKPYAGQQPPQSRCHRQGQQKCHGHEWQVACGHAQHVVP